jgi:hypothetical protein
VGSFVAFSQASVGSFVAIAFAIPSALPPATDNGPLTTDQSWVRSSRFHEHRGSVHGDVTDLNGFVSQKTSID